MTLSGADFELIFHLPPGNYGFYFYCQYASSPASYGDRTTFYHVASDGTLIDFYDTASAKYDSFTSYERNRNVAELLDVPIDSSGYAYFIVSSYDPTFGWFLGNPIVNGVQIYRH